MTPKRGLALCALLAGFLFLLMLATPPGDGAGTRELGPSQRDGSLVALEGEGGAGARALAGADSQGAVSSEMALADVYFLLQDGFSGDALQYSQKGCLVYGADGLRVFAADIQIDGTVGVPIQLLSGPITLNVRGYMPFEVSTESGELFGSAAPRVLALNRGVDVLVRVEDHSSEPLGLAMLKVGLSGVGGDGAEFFMQKGEGEQLLKLVDERVRQGIGADSNGRVHLVVPLESFFSIGFRAPYFGEGWNGYLSRDDWMRPREIVMRTFQTVKLEGRVVDHLGNAVGDYPVELWPENADTGNGGIRLRTNESGLWRTFGIVPGPARLVGRGPGRPGITAQVPSDGSPFPDLVVNAEPMRLTGCISFGRAVDVQGYIRVLLRGPNGGVLEGSWLDRNGCFKLDRPRGTCVLQVVSYLGNCERVVRDVVVDALDSNIELDIESDLIFGYAACEGLKDAERMQVNYICAVPGRGRPCAHVGGSVATHVAAGVLPVFRLPGLAAVEVRSASRGVALIPIDEPWSQGWAADLTWLDPESSVYAAGTGNPVGACGEFVLLGRPGGEDVEVEAGKEVRVNTGFYEAVEDCRLTPISGRRVPLGHPKRDYGAIHVVIEDEGGARVEGATVIVRPSAGAATARKWQRIVPEDGVLEFGCLPYGPYEVRAYLGDGSVLFNQIDLSSSEETLVLKAQTGPRIEVQVIVDGEPDPFVRKLEVFYDGGSMLCESLGEGRFAVPLIQTPVVVALILGRDLGLNDSLPRGASQCRIAYLSNGIAGAELRVTTSPAYFSETLRVGPGSVCVYTSCNGISLGRGYVSAIDQNQVPKLSFGAPQGTTGLLYRFAAEDRDLGVPFRIDGAVILPY